METNDVQICECGGWVFDSNYNCLVCGKPALTLDQLIKNRCFDFINWTYDNKWLRMKKDEWWNIGIPKEQQVELTTEQLYDRYEKTKQ